MTKFNENFVSTPTTNRGVVNTESEVFLPYLYGFVPNFNQYMIFDWLQCTIFDNFGLSERDYFNIIFGIPYDLIVFENKALFGYEYTYSYKNIKLFSSNDSSLGYHFYITGQGCRNIEELNLNYFDIFKKLLHYNCKFTRVDISIDDFTNKYFDIKKLRYYINKGYVKSKFKSTIQFIKTGIGSDKLDGNTIWFGSRSSKIMICFYDKKQERLNNNCILNSEIKFWTRTEIRFRDLKAQEVITNLCTDSKNMNNYIKGLLLNYIQFLIPSDSDSNKSRWFTCDWWLNFCDNVNSLRLLSLPYETSISKKTGWIHNTVSKSEFSVLISNIPNLTSDFVSSEFIYNILVTGSDKITEKDLQFINEYRLSRGYNPLTLDDIKFFIRDIKDVLLLKK